MALVGITKSFYTYKDDTKVDAVLPEGAGGYVRAAVTYIPHDGLNIRKQEVFVTYKRDDLVNLWEGRDDVPTLTGITEAFATHKPHDGLDIRGQDAFVNYRPHDGLDIRKLDAFANVRDDSKVNTFKIPYGSGGRITAYALYRMLQLVGYLYNLTDVKIQGIVVGNNYIQLKVIETINRISLKNNTTTDLSEEDADG